jgi:hypothetical protein
MVKFIYNNNQTRNIDRDKVIVNVVRLAKKHIELPDYILVEYKDLGNHIYAETLFDRQMKNKITLNEQLGIKEVIKPVIHELLHLEQIHTGKLAVYKSGDILYEGKSYFLRDQENLSYEEYCNLPWEFDVRTKETKLFDKLMGTV